MGGHPYPRHVIRSKVVPARIPEGFVVRDRVLAHMSVDHRCTLVSALPGYGKTAAVRQWIDTVDAPVAWLSLDLLDQEPVSFWSHVLAALGSAHPGIDGEPAMLLRERGADDPLFIGALAAGLADVGTPIVLVLDGLSDQVGQGVIDGLTLLVELAGDTLRMVATTRSDPPLPVARWRALGWLNEVREDTLSLTDDEALAIAACTDTAIRDADEVIALNRRVDSWPIGFHMALLSRPGGSTLPMSSDPAAGSDRLLAEYLAAEVLAAMSQEEREVAFALCVLDRFDPDMCAQLVGPHAGEAVRRLLQRGLFLSVVDPRVGTMRFHDLFRELMETELGYRDPVARVELHRRAAMLWRARGDLMSAYHHLAVIGETGTARELLLEPTLVMVDRGEFDDLHRFARHVPPPHQVASADLALDFALISLHADGTLSARRWCDRAETLLDEGMGDGDGDGGVSGDEQVQRLLGLRCKIALLDADLDSALTAIENHRLPPAGSGDVFEQRLPLVAAKVALAARRKEDAAEWISVAQHVAGPPIVTEVTVPTLRAWYEWLFGSLRRALTLVDGALTWVDQHHVNGNRLAFDTLTTAGWCRLTTGDINEAKWLADRAWADAEAIGHAWNHLQAGSLRARLALVTGEPTRALHLIDGLRDSIAFESCRPYSDRIRGIEIEALAATGRVGEAVDQIDALGPGPRSRLLRARFAATSDGDVGRLLADHANWPAIDRLQAELLLNARRTGEPPSSKLIGLVADAAEAGWVLPFLGMGPRVERVLRDLPLRTVHPQLERTLDYLAPALHAGAAGRSDIRLTSRELTLLELLPTHLTKAEMGERLYLSVNTVKSNLTVLYRKLGASTRTEAVEAARRAGLI
jgi:LuxR family maltose regulon positive regulatory protein